MFGRQVLATTEGSTVPGARVVRLMPETILRQAAGDRGEAVRLLKLHGYL